MSAKKKETLSYWEERAKRVNDLSAVTHSDTFQRQLESDAILKYLQKGDQVLDVGCGNGFGTSIFSKHCARISGIDFSPAMIARAKVENSRKGKISYKVADIRNQKIVGKYSKILTVRCLINILNWEGQKKALKNIAGAVKTGGLFLMMEGIADGRAELNKTRVRLGLNKLPSVAYNLDFEKKRTELVLKKYFTIEKFLTFGNYELITRILYPLYVFPAEPTYGSKFHEIALNVCGNARDFAPEISKLGMWVLKKRG